LTRNRADITNTALGTRPDRSIRIKLSEDDTR